MLGTPLARGERGIDGFHIKIEPGEASHTLLLLAADEDASLAERVVDLVEASYAP